MRLGNFSFFALLVLLASCAQDRTECLGPEINFSAISNALNSPHQSGAFTNLILPNPLDAEQPLFPTGEPSLHAQLQINLPLLGLTSISRLENSFLRIRRHTIDESTDGLASPNNEGKYDYEISEIGYSETMAYYATKTIQNYIEALGFSINQSRPLYVLVRSLQEGQDPNEINAFYEHNPLSDSPRIMRMIGGGAHAPGDSQDMHRHEFGHLLTESLTGDVGVDFAGDNGAVYTAGSSLHECLADYLAQTVSNRPYIGRWIAKNFFDIPDGEPLRYGIDVGQRLLYDDVAYQDGQGAAPERYAVAEWCSRVLWELREQFVSEESEVGNLYADRLIFSAMSLLGQDASIQDFSKALVDADQTLHCGFHEKSIRHAFESRGFEMSPAQHGNRLQLVAQAVGIEVTGSGLQVGPLRAGGEMAFQIRVTNTNSVTARNVRIHLESLSQGLFPTTYQQGLGDLLPGQTVFIDATGAGLPISSSVFALIDQGFQTGQNILFRLHVLTDNGPDTVQEDFFTL